MLQKDNTLFGQGKAADFDEFQHGRAALSDMGWLLAITRLLLAVYRMGKVDYIFYKLLWVPVAEFHTSFAKSHFPGSFSHQFLQPISSGGKASCLDSVQAMQSCKSHLGKRAAMRKGWTHHL